MSGIPPLELACMLYCFTFGFYSLIFKKYPVTFILGPALCIYFIFFNPILGAAVVTVGLIVQLRSGEFFNA